MIKTPGDSVDFYTKLKGEVDVYFPNGKEVCQYCRYSRSQSDFKRFYCVLTDEFLLNPFATRGNLCPLESEEENV